MKLMMKYKVKYKLTLVLGNVTCLTWTMWLSSVLYLQVGYWTENFTKLFLLLSKTLGKLHSVVWASNLNFKKFLSKYLTVLKMQLICYIIFPQSFGTEIIWNYLNLKSICNDPSLDEFSFTIMPIIPFKDLVPSCCYFWL